MKTYSILFFVIALVSGFYLVIMAMAGLGSLAMPSYYSNRNNYRESQGIIAKMEELSDGQYLLLIESEDQVFSYQYRMIVANRTILKEHGFFDEVKVEDTVTLTYAPRIFGDGYTVPIVELKTEDKVYLEFENGFNNLVEDTKERRAAYLNMVYPGLGVFGLSIIMGSFLLLYPTIKNKNVKKLLTEEPFDYE